MAHYEQTLTGDADAFLAHLQQAVVGSSISADAEGSSDHTLGDARMSVRVFERYSAWGGNRVSLTVSVLAVGEALVVSAFSAGGSQAVFWKVNTWGEENFLAKGVEAIRSFGAAS